MARFILASNRHGPRNSGQFALARGILLDADTGERQWEQLDPDDLPADVPIDAILAASIFGRDPTTNNRYVLKTANGDISLVPEGTVYTTAEHGFTRPSALFIDADGTFYVLKRIDLSIYNIATITKGEVDPSSGERIWFTLAETEPYERCDCIYNHEVNALIVSPDNRSLFINSGSRTDHGEIQDGDGHFPGLRETALTAVILRVPTNARDLVLPNSRYASSTKASSLPRACAMPTTSPSRPTATSSPRKTDRAATCPRNSIGCAKGITTASPGAWDSTTPRSNSPTTTQPPTSSSLPAPRPCAKATTTTIPRTRHHRAISPTR